LPRTIPLGEAVIGLLTSLEDFGCTDKMFNKRLVPSY